MNGEGRLDYELYLDTPRLLSCQKPFDKFCNHDELMFQVVHQSEELWMKLIGWSLMEVDDWIAKKNTNRVLTLMGRVHQIMHLLTDSLGVLETMSPKEYQEIRLQLGNGSGQESPGFRTLLKMYQPIWDSYKKYYLDAQGLTVEKIYDSEYKHDDAYMVAEALIEYDELFQKFRYHHIQLIHRSIGLGSKSLKGRPVDLLNEGMRQKFFPELWEVRSQMTDAWGGQYGLKREAIGEKKESK